MSAGYVVSDTYLALLAEAVVDGVTPDPSGYTLHLFVNDATIGDGNQDATGLTPASWDGYTPLNAAVDTWGAAVTTAHVAAITAPAPIEFAAGSGGPSQTVYGYWVEDVDGNFCWAESFAAGQLVDPGGTYKITPSFRQKTCR